MDGRCGFIVAGGGFDRGRLNFSSGHGLLRWSFRHAEEDRFWLSKVTHPEGLWPQLKRIAKENSRPANKLEP